MLSAGFSQNVLLRIIDHIYMFFSGGNEMDFTDNNSPENMERWLNEDFEPGSDATISQSELYSILYPAPGATGNFMPPSWPN